MITTLLLIFISPYNSYPADKVTQGTKGNQSPAVNVAPGGTASFNYGVPNRAMNISPEIKYKLEYPFKVEKDAVRKQTRNPELIVTNVGPIKATAFSVDCKGYVYDKNLASIVESSELKKETHGHLIFVKELQPSEDIKAQLNGFHGKDKIGIYVFTLKYYRDSDMKLFSYQDTFFIENYEIFSEKTYSENSNYHKIIQAIKSYTPPSGSGMYIQAIDDHNWFVKETPTTGIIMLDDDRKGLTYGGIPEDPRAVIKQNYLNVNRPLLYVSPSKLEETGTYLSFEIIDEDTINIKIRYEIENVGDMEAINVSEPAGTPYNKPLKPGEKIYFYPKLALTNTSGPKESPQDLTGDLDKPDFVVEQMRNVFYFQESGNKEYIARFVYRIWKNKFQLIKYETK
jgi:hypothetical protein